MHRVALVVLLVLTGLGAAADGPPRQSDADKAIERAISYLARTQQADGCWLSQGSGGKSPAATSLAVMAFLAAGHVPGEGKYGPNVEKGIQWVMRCQQPNGVFATDQAPHQMMYHHGISTLMLAEVAGMTDGELAAEARRKLEKAVAVILKAQRTGGDARGGWRYSLSSKEDSDISVTGWQLMALRGAKNLGCDVPSAVIDRAVEFIRRCQDKNSGGFMYMPRNGVTVACTGTSVLALELCGKDLHHSPEALRGGAYLLRDNNLPSWNQPYFFYGVYYGAQATFQLGGNYWSVYRPRLHKVLLEKQEQDGSWSGPGSDQGFGRAYCTSMAVLALAVDYRFLPIYQRSEESTDPEK
jgi:hypothetical protein